MDPAQIHAQYWAGMLSYDRAMQLLERVHGLRAADADNILHPLETPPMRPVTQQIWTVKLRTPEPFGDREYPRIVAADLPDAVRRARRMFYVATGQRALYTLEARLATTVTYGRGR